VNIGQATRIVIKGTKKGGSSNSVILRKNGKKKREGVIGGPCECAWVEDSRGGKASGVLGFLGGQKWGKSS